MLKVSERGGKRLRLFWFAVIERKTIVVGTIDNQNGYKRNKRLAKMAKKEGRQGKTTTTTKTMDDLRLNVIKISFSQKTNNQVTS